MTDAITSRLAAASLPVTRPMRRGSRGSGALSLGREEPFGRELLLEPLERGEVGAEAEALDREHLEAQLALLRPHLGAAVDVDSLAVRQVEAERVEPPSRKGCFHARAAVLVLEREEHGLPALLAPQLGDLALDPDGWQPPEPVGEAAVEGGDGEDLAVAVLDRLDLRHAEIVRRQTAPARGRDGE